MKNIEVNDVNESIDGVRLFREDIEEIMSKFKSKTLSLEISDAKNLYDSLDELIQYIGSNPSKLNLVGSIKDSYGSIGINFKGSSAWLYAFGSKELYIFSYELKDFLKGKIPWSYKVFNPWIWAILAYLCLQVSWLSQIKTLEGGNISTWFFWSSLFLFFIFFICMIFRRMHFGIKLTRKHETGFLKRNVDQILLILIGSIVGTVLTLFVQWLIGM